MCSHVYNVVTCNSGADQKLPSPRSPSKKESELLYSASLGSLHPSRISLVAKRPMLVATSKPVNTNQLLTIMCMIIVVA